MHLVVMLIFAAIVSVVFAGVTSEVQTDRERIIYALRVFGSFMGVGLLAAIIFYFFP
ncbi:MAG: hypothetical protein RMM17_01220 [Acidobacteriota bacterium]|nr:hypothetical protein [Blastocatellia bacterium]MDW8411289.1 hypothetical protein [Acidobacteriota bacterium]